MLASGSSDNTVRVWVPRYQGHSKVLKGHCGPVSSVHFSPDGSRLVTGSDDTTVKTWPEGSLTFSFDIKTHKNPVRCVRFSPCGNILASCGKSLLVLSDLRKRKATHEYHFVSSTPVCLAFHSTHSFLAVGMDDGSV